MITLAKVVYVCIFGSVDRYGPYTKKYVQAQTYFVEREAHTHTHIYI